MTNREYYFGIAKDAGKEIDDEYLKANNIDPNAEYVDTNYLNDEQYVRLLDMVEEKVKTTNVFRCDDCTTIGDKSTSSTVGLCCEDYETTLDMDLFSYYYIKYGKRSKKYRDDVHACPFDDRVRTEQNKNGGLMKLGCGCYYTCGLNNKMTQAIALACITDTREKFLTGDLDRINLKLSGKE
jgi:hypothetical protein